MPHFFRTTRLSLLASLAAFSLTPPATGAAAEPEAPAAYAAVGSGISYYNTPNRKHTNIVRQETRTLASVSLELAKPADVLVQFTSQLGNAGKAGCPCSVRAALVADNGTPVVVKRVNLSGGTGEGADYVPDRQGNDGSFVFSMPAGHHDVALTVQQVGGAAETIQAFYANLQALVFAR